MDVSKQTAELAKIKGFDEDCRGYYKIDTCYRLGYCYHTRMGSQNSELGSDIAAPTQSELQTWLRDTYNCLVIADYHSRIDNDELNPEFKSKSDIKFKVEIDYYGANFEIEQGEETDYLKHSFDSYEEALEDGLVKALRMLPKEVKIIPFTSNEGIVGEFIEVDSQTNFGGNYEYLGKKGCFMDVSEENLRLVLSGTDDFAYDKEFDSVEELREEVNRLRKIQPINEQTDLKDYGYLPL